VVSRVCMPFSVIDSAFGYTTCGRCKPPSFGNPSRVGDIRGVSRCAACASLTNLNYERITSVIEGFETILPNALALSSSTERIAGILCMIRKDTFSYVPAKKKNPEMSSRRASCFFFFLRRNGRLNIRPSPTLVCNIKEIRRLVPDALRAPRSNPKEFHKF